MKIFSPLKITSSLLVEMDLNKGFQASNLTSWKMCDISFHKGPEKNAHCWSITKVWDISQAL